MRAIRYKPSVYQAYSLILGFRKAPIRFFVLLTKSLVAATLRNLDYVRRNGRGVGCSTRGSRHQIFGQEVQTISLELYENLNLPEYI